MNASSKGKRLLHKTIRPSSFLALGFLVLIALGGLVLTLPAASATGRSLGLLKGLFTATSAVCVTGLSIIDVGTQLSGFGQGVLLVLIQVGGLGFMVFSTLAMVVLGRRISLRSRVLISESMNQNSLTGMVKLTLLFSAMALVIELTGAAVLCTQFIPQYGVGRGIWFSLFHAISAFCNAGFDLLGNNTSLTLLSREPVLLLTVTLLIILGGVGFAVMLECIHLRKSKRSISLQTKLVLSVTGILLLSGTLAVLGLEWSNPLTLGQEGFTFWDKLVNSLFQSTTFRTAGFASLDQAQLNDTTKLLGCFYMFIGASPASTGGGVKTTTFATALLLVWSVMRGYDRITLFGKELSQDLAKRAVAIITIFLSSVFLISCAVSVLERHSGIPLLDLVYETTSAMSTTGLSSVGTANLRISSQILLMPLMYLGRVGPLTLAVALANRTDSGIVNRVRHPEEKIMIG